MPKELRIGDQYKLTAKVIDLLSEGDEQIATVELSPPPDFGRQGPDPMLVQIPVSELMQTMPDRREDWRTGDETTEGYSVRAVDGDHIWLSLPSDIERKSVLPHQIRPEWRDEEPDPCPSE